MLVACGRQSDALPISLTGDAELVNEEGTSFVQDTPRLESTPTPPLPPTFTPSAMAHQGHLYLLPVSGADGSIQYAYKVRVGDTLTAICEMYNVSMNDVMLINDISDANHIEVGNLLIIPVIGGG
jgi:LysM repeat protein